MKKMDDYNFWEKILKLLLPSIGLSYFLRNYFYKKKSISVIEKTGPLSINEFNLISEKNNFPGLIQKKTTLIETLGKKTSERQYKVILTGLLTSKNPFSHNNIGNRSLIYTVKKNINLRKFF